MNYACISLGAKVQTNHNAVARCPALIRAFNAGVDVFKMLWANFRCPKDPDVNAVSEEERRTAKKLCYGILYRQVCGLVDRSGEWGIDKQKHLQLRL